jgi:hypothetical protein
MPWENIKFWLQPEAVAAGSCSGIHCAALALGAGAVNYALVIRTGTTRPACAAPDLDEPRAGNARRSPPVTTVWRFRPAVTYQRYLAKYNAKRESMWAIGTA